MSARSSDLVKWSARRWAWVVAGLLVLQVLALVVFSGHPLPAAAVGARAARWPRFQLPKDGGAACLASLAAQDPTVFAVPGPHGFAGMAWLKPSEFAMPERGWQEPVRWLGANTNWFGMAVARGAGPGSARTSGPSDKPVPTLSVVQPAPIPLPDHSVVELDAGLAGRGLAGALVAPVMAHSNLLSATVVQVCVESDGGVFSAVVLQSSGLRAADDQALALARTAKFVPGAGGGTGGAAQGARLWGQLRFRWHTVEPGAGGGA